MLDSNTANETQSHAYAAGGQHENGFEELGEDCLQVSGAADRRGAREA